MIKLIISAILTLGFTVSASASENSIVSSVTITETKCVILFDEALDSQTFDEHSTTDYEALLNKPFEIKYAPSGNNRIITVNGDFTAQESIIKAEAIALADKYSTGTGIKASVGCNTRVFH